MAFSELSWSSLVLSLHLTLLQVLAAQLQKEVYHALASSCSVGVSPQPWLVLHSDPASKAWVFPSLGTHLPHQEILHYNALSSSFYGLTMLNQSAAHEFSTD